MDSPYPSIQSFYSREIPPMSPNPNDESPEPLKLGDGFTSSEVEAVVNPLSLPWEPSRTYETCPISFLEAGVRNYHIQGRVVNFMTVEDSHLFLILTDGSGAIAVKVYYLDVKDYKPRLGQRATVWSSFISEPTTGGIGNVPFCTAVTSIYPGRNTATHIILHDDTPDSDGDRILRCPLECNLREYDHLPELMTLKAFLATGYDMGEGKILVCVRSVGLRRTIRLKQRQGTIDMVEVGVFDDTAMSVLKLWEDKVASAKTWVPNQTVLLISKPTYKKYGKVCEIGIRYNSMVDVDPQFPDADWLRKWAKAQMKRESISIPFPSDTWDVGVAIHGPGRTLFTIADIDDQVRHTESNSDFTGKLSVIILEMKLMEHWRKNTTCCSECCGIPLYANKPVGICKNCQSQRDLILNPRIIGSIVDESGMIAGCKLVWHNEAWTQLFFGGIATEALAEDDQEVNLVEQSWEDLTLLDTNSIRSIEEQLLYSRVTLTFGWSSKLERVCILGVEW
ncbi:hypothetical protein F4818DRAFT_456249 [Hypoxylon cercidicola]|nr:hypothetical protein F4818DRAFT_456249 [Hypoxylon cercidicola]